MNNEYVCTYALKTVKYALKNKEIWIKKMQ
jgi:hypothetical protein